MKYKSLFILVNFGYTLKTEYKNSGDFYFLFFHFLAIEILQNHLIFEFLIFNFVFLVKFRQ
jgi:hypothetical protein